VWRAKTRFWQPRTRLRCSFPSHLTQAERRSHGRATDPPVWPPVV
jgi:hypothetical protein